MREDRLAIVTLLIAVGAAPVAAQEEGFTLTGAVGAVGVSGVYVGEDDELHPYADLTLSYGALSMHMELFYQESNELWARLL